MNIQPKFDPNATEQALVSAFAERKAQLPGGDALAGLRAEAMARFSALGLPHRRNEDWHYTDLRRVLRESAAAPALAGGVDPATFVPLAAFATIDAARLVFVAGRFSPDRSDLEGLGEGVEVSTLGAGTVPDWALAEIAERRPASDNAMFDLATALASDGALIRIHAGITPARAIQIVALSGGGGTFLQNIVVVEPGAQLRLIECAGGDAAMSSVASSLHLGDGARIDHVKVQAEGEAVTHIAPSVTHVGAGCRLNSFTLSLGAALAREERHVRFRGEGTDGSISGAFLLRGNTHSDTTLQVDHDLGGCESREIFKGIVDDRAKSVVQNRVVVAKDAQKTDARQGVHALLLSDEAEHNTKPELEIYADDVQCAHGATIGELDDEALFYLMARGITRPVAEAMLITSFVSGAMEEVADEAMRAAVMDLASQRLAERLADG